MKKTLYLLFAFCMLAACNPNDDPTLTNPKDDEPVISTASVDSVQLNLLDIGNLSIRDFTARIPGFIWGCTYVEDAPGNQRNSKVLFSYNLSTEEIEYVYGPPEIDLDHFLAIEAGPDGKLYIHSYGFKYKEVAIYDTQAKTWSRIEVNGFVNGITVDEASNALWVAHEEGVSRYQNGELFTFDDTNSNLQRIVSGSNNSFFGHALAVDKEGIVWYANQNELYTFKNDQWSLHPSSPLSENYIIWRMVAAESEGVFVQIPREFTYRLQAASEISRLKEDATISDFITIDILHRASDKSIIYSHSKGFLHYSIERDSVISVNSRNSLLPDASMELRLDHDHEGNVWIGGIGVLGILPREL